MSKPISYLDDETISVIGSEANHKIMPKKCSTLIHSFSNRPQMTDLWLKKLLRSLVYEYSVYDECLIKLFGLFWLPLNYPEKQLELCRYRKPFQIFENECVCDVLCLHNHRVLSRLVNNFEVGLDY